MAWGVRSRWLFRGYYQGFLRWGGPRCDSSRSDSGALYWARDDMVGGIMWGELRWNRIEGTIRTIHCQLVGVVTVVGCDWLCRIGVGVNGFRQSGSGDMYCLAHSKKGHFSTGASLG